jgi:hypothetical protein
MVVISCWLYAKPEKNKWPLGKNHKKDLKIHGAGRK